MPGEGGRGARRGAVAEGQGTSLPPEALYAAVSAFQGLDRRSESGGRQNAAGGPYSAGKDHVRRTGGVGLGAGGGESCVPAQRASLLEGMIYNPHIGTTCSAYQWGARPSPDRPAPSRRRSGPEVGVQGCKAGGICPVVLPATSPSAGEGERARHQVSQSYVFLIRERSLTNRQTRSLTKRRTRAEAGRASSTRSAWSRTSRVRPRGRRRRPRSSRP